MLASREGSVMSGLLRDWNLADTLPNPLYANRISSKMSYLRQYITDMSDVSTYPTDENRKRFKRRVYEALLRLTNNESTPSAMRIVRKFPRANWEHVWKNLHNNVLSDTVKSKW